MDTVDDHPFLASTIQDDAEALVTSWLTDEIMSEGGFFSGVARAARAPSVAQWSELGEKVLEALASGDHMDFAEWLMIGGVAGHSDRLIQVATQLLLLRVQERAAGDMMSPESRWTAESVAALRQRSTQVMSALFDWSLKRSRDAMPTEAAEFREMASVLRDSLYSTLVGGLVRYVSPSIEPLTGHAPEDFLEDPNLWSSLLLREDLEIFRMLFSEAIEGRESMEAVYRLRNAETHRVHHVLDRVTPVISEDGEVTRLDGILIDITDRIEFETRLERAEQLRILGQLARDIAHDFNNLLVSILGHTDLILSKLEEDDPKAEGLRLVGRAAEKGARLTERLLAFARGSSSAGSRESVQLDDVVREVIELARPSAPRHLELRLDAPPSIPIIQGNTTSLSEAILNLVLNGIHACTEGQGTAVTLKISHGDIDDCHLIGASRATVLEIIDDGHGMSDEVKQRVFEPLFTTRTAIGGTGLGCALAFGVAIEHGGVLEVDSVEGLGTTFTMILPAKQDADVPTKPMTPVVGLQHTGREGPAVVDEEAVAPPTERKGPRVLAVDDDPNVGRLIKDLLQGAGYRVTTADTGEAVLEHLRSEEVGFDLLLMDVMMHPMDGSEVATRAAKLRPELPMLFCSGYTSTDTVVFPEVLERIPLLPKPFRAARLFEMVRASLEDDSEA